MSLVSAPIVLFLCKSQGTFGETSIENSLNLCNTYVNQIKDVSSQKIIIFTYLYTPDKTPGCDDMVCYFSACKQQGASRSISLLKLNYFHQEQRQRCSPI